MATTFNIRGISVTFPCEPYSLQKDYMEKVISCLQSETNGVLESPTGTGKTLALLCSSLAWLSVKKAQVQARCQISCTDETNEYMEGLKADLDMKVGNSAPNSQAFFRAPTIIYASRTHSQLSQAMNELKRTAYNHMRASVIGSREQMCIHPDIMKEESSSVKIYLCRSKVLSKSCHFYNQVERKKEDPAVRQQSVVDIEDLVKLGQKHRFCPYFMAKDLKQHADIIFMPYNYLLDPRARKALGIELVNTVVILDEAHNIEKMCEESASLQIKSTDIALCIDEITEVMKAMSEETSSFLGDDIPKDFTAEELCTLKEMLLKFEKVLDEIELKKDPEGTVFEGTYIFEILSKTGIQDQNKNFILGLIEKIVQFLSTAKNQPFARKGNGLELFADLLNIVFANQAAEFKEKLRKCFKVHLCAEEQNKKVAVDWLSKVSRANKQCRILSYWCFSPGFGMQMLMRRGIKTLILTSGTLAPLSPLISELEVSFDVRLENPHVVSTRQVCVKVLCKGPDGEILNCNYQNRNNHKYISSLGRSIINTMRMIPGGLLIFFPSYSVMKNFQECWQSTGIWTEINSLKQIFVEPKTKEAFNCSMNDYYSKISEQSSKGAIMMGVCRGKLSEGLDFADMNGRAVIIIGLPYPPLKDPRVILKKRYLDICNSNNKEYLKGDEWYSLEASRAVNQAIGRVIRHQHDYGAIILMDTRFTGIKIKSQMSLWLRDRIQIVDNFGKIIVELKTFFRNAAATLPVPKLKGTEKSEDELKTASTSEFDIPTCYKKQNLFDFSANSLPSESESGLVTIQKRPMSSSEQSKPKKRKVTLVSSETEPISTSVTDDAKVYILTVKEALESRDFLLFVQAIRDYRNENNFDSFVQCLDKIFLDKYNLRYIIQGLSPYIKDCHRDNFESYWQKMRI